MRVTSAANCVLGIPEAAADAQRLNRSPTFIRHRVSNFTSTKAGFTTIWAVTGMRALIVDDEPLARDRIRLLLERDTSVTAVAEARSGQEALEVIPKERPDVIFLDVQMPGLSGFEMLEKLTARPMPAVVFVTAHDQYAVRAFEFHAVDYLLKPVERERLKLALDRAANRVQTHKVDDLPSKNAAMLADLRAGARGPERIPIKNNGRISFVSLADIDWVGSADNYAELHVGTHNHLIRETLSSLSERLPVESFCRVSRTSIINLSRLKELQPLPHGEYVLTLTTGAKVTLSRTYRDQLPRLKQG